MTFLNYTYKDGFGSIRGVSEVRIDGEMPVYVNGELVYSPRQTFQVGDFVRVTKVYPHDSFLGVKAGMVGKVVTESPLGNVGVELPEITKGHDCNGCAASPHGKWFNAESIELIDRPIDTTFPS